ncbi:MAG TPA: protein kinase [Polyangia bacterium]|nr:protein kinase [Polyangia bacterium]
MRAGDVIAERYEIEQLAGVGGMGAVYRARERGTGATVALKVLRGGGREDELRLAREARLLADLDHPSVVRYLGQGLTSSGEFYLVMEWLEGENLDQRLTRSGLSMEESLTMARHVAEALGAAHARGFVHRDIKPANVFLVGGRVDDVRVLDFGIARSLAATGVVTRTGALVGTLGYIAPEQARSGAPVDVRSDVFALGCILFECLTGRPAFSGDGVMAVLVKVLFEPAPRVAALCPDVPAALDDLVARMMAKDPAERPQNAFELARELESIRRSDELRAQPATARPSTLTDAERRLISVVVATSGTPSVEFLQGETQPMTGAILDVSDLEAAVAPFGARLERLHDGSMVATLMARGSASEQALRAARTALAMRALFPRPEVAIGLATGRGSAPSSHTRDELPAGGVPIGEVIDRAVRLLVPGGAPPDPRSDAAPIYLDAVTAGFLEARFQVTQISPGRFELGEEREVLPAEGTARRLLGRATSCVGRDLELATLASYFDECVETPVPRALLVTGAPGMGKSRLGYEFLRRARQEKPAVEIWVAHGAPMSADSPLGLLGQLLRHATGVQEGEPLERRRTQVRECVRRHAPGPAEARVAEFLGELAGVPFDDTESLQLRAARRNPQLMGDQMRQAWLDLLAAATAQHPVILVLEDLQWGDAPSVQWLDGALRDLPERPLFVLALGRPEVHDRFPRLWAERGPQEVRLGELSRKASERLVRQVLGPSVSPQTLDQVVRQAAGNAFFLEELIRAVAEGKEHALPETVLAMLQVRLEELDADLRRVIRAASLFGENFWAGGLYALLEGDRSSSRPAPGIESSLRQLVARELIAIRTESRFTGEKEYCFRHAFVREAAYAMLTEGDRVLGHRLAGQWLEAAGEQDALVLAGHFERGQEAVRAAVYHERAATQASLVGDFGAAIERAERIVASGAEGAQLGRARLIQAEAYRWRSEFGIAEQHSEEAKRLLPPHSPSWFHAMAEAVEIAFLRGDHRRAVGFVEELRRPVEGAPALASQFIVLASVTETLLRIGRLASALELCRQLEPALAGASDGDPLVTGHVRKILAMRHAALGDPAAAHDTLLPARADFERAGDVRQVEYVRLMTAVVMIRLGRLEEAIPALRESETVMNRLGATLQARWARFSLCNALVTHGALAEAEEIMKEHILHRRAQANPVFLGKALWILSTLLLRMGRLDEAEAAAREAMAQRGHASSVVATLAHILLRREHPEQALPLAQQAVRMREEMGLGLEEKDRLVPLTLAEALWATGDAAGARAAIAAARDGLLATAGRLPEATWQRSFLALPENARTLALAEEWLGG